MLLVIILLIVSIGRFGFEFILFSFGIGLDTMNCWFLFLSYLLFPLFYFVAGFESSMSYILLFVFIVCLICFSIYNVILFILYFELSIVLLLFMLLLKSYSNYRVRSSLIFFLFSSFSSFIFSILSLLYIWFLLFSSIQYFGLMFIISLSIKVPLWPFHYWLPVVHAEASTSLSLLLAAIILKLGIFAIIRFIITLYFISLSYYLCLIVMTSIIGVIYAIIDLFFRLDYKIIIALSSISHMNMTSAALFTLSSCGFASSIIISVAHSFTSISLFLFAGLIINKSLSRCIDSIWFLSFSYRLLLFIILLANLSFPLSLTFIGEILALYSLASLSIIITFLLFIISATLSTAFFFLFFNRFILYFSFSFNISLLELFILLFFSLHNYLLGSIFYL